MSVIGAPLLQAIPASEPQFRHRGPRLLPAWRKGIVAFMPRVRDDICEKRAKCRCGERQLVNCCLSSLWLMDVGCRVRVAASLCKENVHVAEVGGADLCKCEGW